MKYRKKMESVNIHKKGKRAVNRKCLFEAFNIRLFGI